MRDIGKLSDICEGLTVVIETREGICEGKVLRILTKRDNPKGIKVELETGQSGRIKKIIDEAPISKKFNRANSYLEPVIFNEEVKEPLVISIKDTEIDTGKTNIYLAGDKKYAIMTKFFKPIYCKKVHEELSGAIIFKVNAENINIAIYKINKFLKKFCITKDIKYTIIKVEAGI